MSARLATAILCLLAAFACGEAAADKAAGPAPGAELDRAAGSLAAAVTGKVTAGREKTKTAVAPFAIGGKRDTPLGTELAGRTALALETRGKGKIQIFGHEALTAKLEPDEEPTDDRIKDAARQLGADVLIEAQIIRQDDCYEVLLKAYRVDDLYLLAAAKEKIKRSEAIDALLEKPVRSAEDEVDVSVEGADSEIRMGDAAYRNADYEKALSHYLKTAENTDKAGVIYRTAFILQNVEKDYPRAQKFYERLIEQRPGLAEARNNLGNVLRARGDAEGARKRFEEAIQLAPRDAAPHYNLALLLHDAGKMPEALAEFRKAAEMDPQNASAFNNQGEILLETGDMAGAYAAFERTVKLRPAHVNAWTRMAEIALERGESGEAEKVLKQALGKDPLNSRLIMLSARQKLCAGKADDAARECQKLSDAFKSTAEGNCLQALALARKGEFQKAHELLDGAAQERGGLRLVCGARPAIFLAEGKTKEALAAAAEARAVQPPIAFAAWRESALVYLLEGRVRGEETARKALADSTDETEKRLLKCLLDGREPDGVKLRSQAEVCRTELSLAISAGGGNDTASRDLRLKNCLKTTAADLPEHLIATAMIAPSQTPQ
ncbi:MAG TPA: tetratricopeptide repeat protein [Candidatus Brocadiia bacterium]|nr:tetratricopeptide repeat protein [Candidatus Brocadiia bacterium]